MRCGQERSRDLNNANLLGDGRGRFLFKKKSRLGRLANVLRNARVGWARRVRKHAA